MNKRTLLTTAASIFAASTFVAPAFADGVKCGGTNACKGQSACKGTANSCKGQNACKGQGWVETSTTLECVAIGGRPMN